MTDNPSRREILTSIAAIAAGLALPCLGPVSSAMADSASPSAAEIVAAIRAKKMTATSLAKAAFARAKQLQDLKIFIHLNEDPALAAANEIDERFSGPFNGPLAGLPVVIKDNINTVDMPTSGATPALHNAQPRRNAPSVQRLMKAGAIMIGKTNMHE